MSMPTDASVPDPRLARPWYRWYALGLLFVVYVFNFLDRQILNILSQSIKEDLGLSDTQLGLLGGLAFAMFYTVMGVPVARLADRLSRRNVLSACLLVWSLMTAICGAAQGFVHLLLARIGVGVGESGASPSSHSLISDFFPQDSRATALGIYALGIPVGTMLGNLLGGWINEEWGWRVAFVAVGLPGVFVALFVRLALIEPPRGMAETVKVAAGDAPPIREVFAWLWSLRSFRFLSLGGALHAFVGYGVGAFVPAFFMRTHGIPSGELGTYLFYLGFAGIAGTFLGGWVADRLARTDKRWYMWLPGLATLVSVPFSAYVYLAADPIMALWVSAIPGFLGAYYLGPTFSMTQALVGVRMRALASSMLLFILNIIGMGLGPLVTGMVSDGLNAWTPMDDAEALRWALVTVLAANVASTGLYLLAGRHLRADLIRAQSVNPSA